MSKPRVSAWLTEVRTVHSRALAALARIDHLESKCGEEPEGWYRPMDPQRAEIREALEAAARAKYEAAPRRASGRYPVPTWDELPEAVRAHLRREAGKSYAAIAAVLAAEVRERHQQSAQKSMRTLHGPFVHYCTGCRETWPCASELMVRGWEG